MARINLLTIHWGNSYGGTLQTYATVQTLRRLGHEVTLINLVHPKTRFKNRYEGYRSILALVKDFQFYLFKRIRIGHFTKKMMRIEEQAIPECDLTIVGSDQVWNRDITTSLGKSYFLDFVKSGKKIAYASSFGKYLWNEEAEYTSQVKGLLSDFSAISVREYSGVKICEDVFGVNAIQVLDPTLVLGDFNALIKNKKPKHLIYPFILLHSDKTDAICKMISDELKLPVFSGSIYQNIFKSSPKDWLDYMRNSDFIITDSFHGLAFSVLFHKKFIVVCADEKKFARLASLLDLLGLNDRYILSPEDLSARIDIVHQNIDYAGIDSILMRERAIAMDFLIRNIQSSHS